MKGRPILSSLTRSRIVGLLLLVVLAIVASLTVFLSQHPGEPGQKSVAGGKTVFASPGNGLSSMANRLSPGDTLLLRDGLYSNSRLGIDGIHGTSTSPITIRAEHDGKAVIDGGGPPVIEVSNSPFLLFAGLGGTNQAQGGEVYVGGRDH